MYADTIEIYWSEHSPFKGKDSPENRSSYRDLVSQHLDDIQNKEVGLAFFHATCKFKSKIPIIYGGAGMNNCSCPPAGWVRLLKEYQTRSNAFWTELNLTLQSAGRDTAWLVDQLATQRLPTWQNAYTNPEWWGTRTEHIRRAYINTVLPSWQAGQVPTQEQFDVIVLVLKDHLRRGVGCSASIRYDPLTTQVGGRVRPPQIALFHELVHAYYTATGSQLSVEESASETNGRFFEIMSVGLSPFNHARFSENALRAQWPGCEQRTSY
jgi:hypothetical protein